MGRQSCWKTEKRTWKSSKPYWVSHSVISIKIDQKTKSGILLTDETIQESQLTTNICKVLKVGPDAYKDKEKFPNGPYCKVDDWIIITRYAGSRIKIDGGELRIINDDEVLAVVDDPRDILPANIL